jgi:hypothetical protein
MQQQQLSTPFYGPMEPHHHGNGGMQQFYPQLPLPPMPPLQPYLQHASLVQTFLVQRTLEAEQAAFTCGQNYAALQANMSRVEAELATTHALYETRAASHATELASAHAKLAEQESVHRVERSSLQAQLEEAQEIREKESRESKREYCALETRHQEATRKYVAELAEMQAAHQALSEQAETDKAELTAELKEQLGKMALIVADTKAQAKTQCHAVQEQLLASRRDTRTAIDDANNQRRALTALRKQLTDAQETHKSSLAVTDAALRTRQHEYAQSQELVIQTRLVARGAHTRIMHLQGELDAQTKMAEKSAKVLKLAHVNCNAAVSKLRDAEQSLEGIIRMQAHITGHLADLMVAWERKFDYQRMLLLAGRMVDGDNELKLVRHRIDMEHSILNSQRKVVFEFATLVLRHFVRHSVTDTDSIKRMQHGITTIEAHILGSPSARQQVLKDLGELIGDDTTTTTTCVQASPNARQSHSDLASLLASSAIAMGAVQNSHDDDDDEPNNTKPVALG